MVKFELKRRLEAPCPGEPSPQGRLFLNAAAGRYRKVAMTRKCISSGSDFEARIGYSRAVVDGEYVFVSGTTGFNYETMSISDNVVEQAEQCFKNIEKALMQADSSLERVVRVRYIFPNKSDFEPCWPVFSKYLGRARPAATLIVAGLLDEKMKLEIEVTASVGKA